MKTEGKRISTPRLLLVAELLAIAPLGILAVVCTHAKTSSIMLPAPLLLLLMSVNSRGVRNSQVRDWWWAIAFVILALGFSIWDNDIRVRPRVNLSREFDAGVLGMFLIIVLTAVWIIRTERDEAAF